MAARCGRRSAVSTGRARKRQPCGRATWTARCSPGSERRPRCSPSCRVSRRHQTAEERGVWHVPTVREATFELFRAHGMTTIFGNPGSTELPMLAEFPTDFSYVLGLQELAVVGMADGYAQASGRPTHVNLHTAPGVGNAVGGIFNAQ